MKSHKSSGSTSLARGRVERITVLDGTAIWQIGIIGTPPVPCRNYAWVDVI